MEKSPSSNPLQNIQPGFDASHSWIPGFGVVLVPSSHGGFGGATARLIEVADHIIMTASVARVLVDVNLLFSSIGRFSLNEVIDVSVHLENASY